MSESDLETVTGLARLMARAYPGWSTTYAIERAAAVLADVAAAERERLRAADISRITSAQIDAVRLGEWTGRTVDELAHRLTALDELRQFCTAEVDRHIKEARHG